MSFFKKLDGFTLSKVSEGGVKTVSGAIVSLISLTVMFALFLSEIHFYYKHSIVDNMFVNTTQVGVIKAAFDLSFPDIPCARLTIDAVDEMGAPQPHAVHQVYKHKLDKGGARVGEARRQWSGEGMRSEEDVQDLARTHFLHLETMRKTMLERGPKCGNCYGAGDSDECCNTCQEVEAAYDRKGWRFHRGGIAQCHFESLHETEEEQGAEEGGCQIYGDLLLDRNPGSFHIVPHKSVQQNGLKNGLESLLELLSFTFDNFNISHTVDALSFGDSFPGVRSPLDGQVRMLNDTHGMYQYYVKVVPTRYRGLNGLEIESNQYAVTEHLRHLAAGSGRGLPGVYFYYEESPLQVVFQEERKGSWQFLTSVCAIIGGVYTVMGLVDTMLSSFSKFAKKSLL